MALQCGRNHQAQGFAGDLGAHHVRGCQLAHCRCGRGAASPPRRAAISISNMAMSAVQSVSTSGVLVTVMPRALAA